MATEEPYRLSARISDEALKWICFALVMLFLAGACVLLNVATQDEYCRKDCARRWEKLSHGEVMSCMDWCP